MYKHKEIKNRNFGTKLTCNVCGFKSVLEFKFNSHFKKHHIIYCPLKKCQRTYTNYSFKSHLSKQHSYYTLYDFIFEILAPQNTNEWIPLSYVDHNTENFGGNFEQGTEYSRNVSLFILRMQEKILLSHSIVCELICGISELQNDIISLIKQYVAENLKENNVNDTFNKVLSNLMGDLSSLLNIMKSKHLQKKYLKKIKFG